MKFEGKTVFITGANRGIGNALAKACLKRGASKVYAGVRDIKKIPQFDDERIVPVTLDITRDEDLMKAVSVAKDTQILINNAGTLNPGTFSDGNIDGFRRDMEVNFFSTIKIMRAFVPILKKNQDCRIVNIASIAKFTNFPFIAGYSASKAALYSITQAARIELSQYNIVVHAVNPGAIDTDMNRGQKMEMTSPVVVAESILDEVENETLDIIPDKIGKYMFSLWQESPMKLEEAAKNMFLSSKKT